MYIIQLGDTDWSLYAEGEVKLYKGKEPGRTIA
jgi:hypothetical protein